MSARLIAGSCEAPAAGVEEAGCLADHCHPRDVMPFCSPALSGRPEGIPVLFRQYVARLLLADALGRSGGRASQWARAPSLPRKSICDKLAQQGPRLAGLRKGG